MLFKLSSIVLMALAMVHATTIPPSDIDLSEKVAVPVIIVNGGSNATVFTFDGDSPLEVLLPMRLGMDQQYGTWDRYMVSTDAWIFKNRGTHQWLKVNTANDHLITVNDFSPTIFAVEHAGEGKLIIKLPYEDKVWEPLFDGTSMQFGRVSLRPANGSPSQRWVYTA
ncbi:hypothetical protein DFH09DRAFT_1291093 [Mycena vulgaris]|nr:hypothetical protein DFH09DRAFT_1291093 [Mycena vulgaris]